MRKKVLEMLLIAFLFIILFIRFTSALPWGPIGNETYYLDLGEEPEFPGENTLYLGLEFLGNEYRKEIYYSSRGPYTNYGTPDGTILSCHGFTGGVLAQKDNRIYLAFRCLYKEIAVSDSVAGVAFLTVILNDARPYSIINYKITYFPIFQYNAGPNMWNFTLPLTDENGHEQWGLIPYWTHSYSSSQENSMDFYLYPMPFYDPAPTQINTFDDPYISSYDLTIGFVRFVINDDGSISIGNMKANAVLRGYDSYDWVWNNGVAAPQWPTYTETRVYRSYPNQAAGTSADFTPETYYRKSCTTIPFGSAPSIPNSYMTLRDKDCLVSDGSLGIKEVKAFINGFQIPVTPPYDDFSSRDIAERIFPQMSSYNDVWWYYLYRPGEPVGTYFAGGTFWTFDNAGPILLLDYSPDDPFASFAKSDSISLQTNNAKQFLGYRARDLRTGVLPLWLFEWNNISDRREGWRVIRGPEDSLGEEACFWNAVRGGVYVSSEDRFVSSPSNMDCNEFQGVMRPNDPVFDPNRKYPITLDVYRPLAKLVVEENNFLLERGLDLRSSDDNVFFFDDNVTCEFYTSKLSPDGNNFNESFDSISLLSLDEAGEQILVESENALAECEPAVFPGFDRGSICRYNFNSTEIASFANAFANGDHSRQIICKGITSEAGGKKTIFESDIALFVGNIKDPDFFAPGQAFLGYDGPDLSNIRILSWISAAAWNNEKDLEWCDKIGDVCAYPLVLREVQGNNIFPDNGVIASLPFDNLGEGFIADFLNELPASQVMPIKMFSGDTSFDNILSSVNAPVLPASESDGYMGAWKIADLIVVAEIPFGLNDYVTYEHDLVGVQLAGYFNAPFISVGDVNPDEWDFKDKLVIVLGDFQCTSCLDAIKDKNFILDYDFVLKKIFYNGDSEPSKTFSLEQAKEFMRINLNSDSLVITNSKDMDYAYCEDFNYAGGTFNGYCRHSRMAPYLAIVLGANLDFVRADPAPGLIERGMDELSIANEIGWDDYDMDMGIAQVNYENDLSKIFRIGMEQVAPAIDDLYEEIFGVSGNQIERVLFVGEGSLASLQPSFYSLDVFEAEQGENVNLGVLDLDNYYAQNKENIRFSGRSSDKSVIINRALFEENEI